MATKQQLEELLEKITKVATRTSNRASEFYNNPNSTQKDYYSGLNDGAQAILAEITHFNIERAHKQN